MTTSTTEQINGSSASSIRKLPAYNLVLSGGGAKGVQYSGVYDALSKSGSMDNIKAIAGSSAGAISSAFIATGMSAKDFESTTKNLDLTGLLGKKGFGMINKDGTPLYDLLDNTIRNNISNFLETSDIKALSIQRMIDIKAEQTQIQNELDKTIAYHAECTQEAAHLATQMRNAKDTRDIRAIEEQIAEFKSDAKEALNNIGDLQYQVIELRKNHAQLESISKGEDKSLQDLQQKCADKGKIFFKDLSLMRLIEPKKFKDLYVTATNKQTGDLKLFNAKDTPDVEIALACRASGSIPIVFQPVKIDGVTYVDGGYRDNTPYNYFKKAGLQREAEEITNDKGKMAAAKSKGRTMAFVFENDESKVAMYSARSKISEPSKIKQFLSDICDRILSKVVGGKAYSESVKKTYENMRDRSMETASLNTKGIGTLDFKDAQKKQQYLHAAGYVQTMNYLDNHDLASKPDPHIRHEAFFLEVCDKIENTKSHGIWVSKAMTDREVKKETLLEFCMPKKWENKHPEAVLKGFVLLSAISRRDNKFTPNTTAIDSMLSVLNKTTTPDVIKLDFAKTLGKEVRDIKTLHFSKKDIEKFIVTNKDLPVARNAQEALYSGRGK